MKSCATNENDWNAVCDQMKIPRLSRKRETAGSLPIRRRRYICPECGSKGRSSNKNRFESKNRCPFCGEWFHLQIQTLDGIYTEPCKSVNKIEYYI